MRELIFSLLIGLSAQIPKCDEPALTEGTTLKVLPLILKTDTIKSIAFNKNISLTFY